MPDMLQELIAAGAIPKTTFLPTSRYAGIAVEEWDPGDGRPRIPYLQRRFCPLSERLAALHEFRVEEGDRRDVLASQHLTDPELWWRLADANRTVDPRDIHRPVGRRVIVALAEGVPGPSDE